MDGSVKIFNDSINKKNKEWISRSPMSASNSQSMRKFGLKQYDLPENEVAISDSETERNNDQSKMSK